MDILYRQDLTCRNTFRMKVSCACLVEYGSVDELRQLFDGTVDKLPQPLFHIGGGSNLLFAGDFPGTVLHSNIAQRHFSEEGPDGIVLAEIGAAVVWDEFCDEAASRGLWGPENLSAIPGETGAAAVQNIGAYGVEVKDFIQEVRCFDTRTRTMVSLPAADCGYGYRESIFKTSCKGRYIVTSVVFQLSSHPQPRLDYGHIREAVFSAAGEADPTPALVRSVVVGVRDGKLPDPREVGSAGSFFKNPVVSQEVYGKVRDWAVSRHGAEAKVPHFEVGPGLVKIPAAWLIDQCGWKGYREGNVGVYDKQPLVIINATGEAGPQEVLALENKIIISVRDTFGIELSPEVEHVQI